ncbi:DmsE family decaheme c-type cytochrome [Shewanella fidelis]|uniref:DmsE family decaheme c-type cytochrome n=1 Tax=Shewanella fidelis TaxID=173509 RepID=UPI00048A4610|nr:DmsE family decaheme c-type cytochrome [Shewanella fidelis]
MMRILLKIGVLIAFTASSLFITPSVSANQASTPLEQVLVNKFTEAKYSNKGADTCIACHKKSQSVMAIFNTPHGDTNKDPMAGLQCEACHGPQGKHRGKNEPMLTFGNEISVEGRNSVCESCHTQEHTPFHDQACSDCHNIHQAELAVKQPQAQCSNCHMQQESAKFKRSTHLENLACSDCHNPHQEAPLAVNDTCYSCHAEKRGPTLWEHSPVVEDCTTCHNPHGSVNDNLLNSRAPQLCQSCHSQAGHPGDVHNNLDGFTQGQSCMNCHSKIHGSNHPSGHLFEK